jgi:hypothetical protein
MVLKETGDFKVTQGQRVQSVMQVSKVHRVSKAHRARLALKVFKETLVPKDLWVLKVPAQSGRKVHKEFKEPKAM